MAVTNAAASVEEVSLKRGVLRSWRTGVLDDGLRRGMYQSWTEEVSTGDAPTTSRAET